LLVSTTESRQHHSSAAGVVSHSEWMICSPLCVSPHAWADHVPLRCSVTSLAKSPQPVNPWPVPLHSVLVLEKMRWFGREGLHPSALLCHPFATHAASSRYCSWLCCCMFICWCTGMLHLVLPSTFAHQTPNYALQRDQLDLRMAPRLVDTPGLTTGTTTTWLKVHVFIGDSM
jgi:hypothetical protein